MFCVKCRKATNTTDLRHAVSKNGRNMKRGKCVVCGTTKTQFVKGVPAQGGSILNKVINNLPLEN